MPYGGQSRARIDSAGVASPFLTSYAVIAVNVGHQRAGPGYDSWLSGPDGVVLTRKNTRTHLEFGGCQEVG